MRKHRLGKLLLIALCAALLVFFAGCRPSPVLEQIIYEQHHQVDPDTQTKTMNDDLDNEEPDENIPSRKDVEDSEQEKDQAYTAAVAGDEDSDPDTPLYAVYSLAYSPYGDYFTPTETIPTEDSTSETATGSTKSGGSEGGGSPSAVGEDSGNNGMSAGDSGVGNSSGDGQTGEGIPAGEEEAGGGNGREEDNDIESGEEYQPADDQPDKRIVDDDNPDETVEPVIGSRVTAVGEAATIVEMLAGKGQLVGTSSSFYDSFTQEVFADKGASDVPVWWDGDGSDPCNNFNALLEAHPDVCFEISQQDTFSEEQIAALNDAGIAYTVLPELNSIANIESAVTIVGEVLGDHESEGGTNAVRIASEYCDWANNTISWAQGNYDTMYTTYIGRWAPDDEWQIYTTSGTVKWGYGAPVGADFLKNQVTKEQTAPLNECMTAAGVVNEGRDGYYVDPLRGGYYNSQIVAGIAKWSQYTCYVTDWRNNTGTALGESDYPAVIVANQGILNDMLNGEDQYGQINYFYYHWTPQSPFDTGYIYGYGFDDLMGDGQKMTTHISGAYDIYVNPSGVGSWANGSVESPMEALWLASVFQGTISMSDVENEVRNFYSEFYGYDGVLDTSAIFSDPYHVNQSAE